jgi:methylase of polypeptide subunit release factors
MFIDNKDFYPTPKHLIRKMLSKIDSFHDIDYILEPSAGKGAIIEFLKEEKRVREIHAIEKDQEMVSILRGKRIKVIDYDFLSFNGTDKYDLIIANPPFSDGEKHLLKAIDILYSGHIVFLLNAETLKNPYTNTRKDLINKLEELNADIEYIENAFMDADRKTAVEVALIHIEIKRDVEQDLFEGMKEKPIECDADAHKQRELASKDSLTELVAAYNRSVEIGTKTLLDFYRNYYHVAKYLKISSTDRDDKRYYSDEDTLTYRMKSELNILIKNIRRDYWGRALDLDMVKRRLTTETKDQFYQQLNDNEHMDFTENNIRTFLVNLIEGYEDILTKAVDKVFEDMTRKFCWDEDLHTKNVHYFNGWKTNKAFFVNSKVIIPFYGGAFFNTIWGKYEIDYWVKDKIDDIDKVMNYFDGMNTYTSIVDAVSAGLQEGKTSKIESTYFIVTIYKKGTIHLTFRSDDIRRRFNVTACKHRTWLPFEYGRKPYKDMTTEEKIVVDTFEGEKSYTQNLNPSKTLYAKNNFKQLPEFFEK